MTSDDDTEVATQTPSAPVSIAPPANGAGKAARKAKPKAKVAKPAKKAAPAATARPTKAKSAKAKAKGNGKTAKKAATRQRDPSKLDQFGYRLGSIRSKAAAMYASPKGATLGEVKAKVGTIQFNVLTELKERGFKRKTTVEPSKSGREVTRYFVQAPR